MALHRGRLVFISRLTGHLEAEIWFVSLEELVVVGPRFGSPGNARESPTIELAREGCKPSTPEILWQNF